MDKVIDVKTTEKKSSHNEWNIQIFFDRIDDNNPRSRHDNKEKDMNEKYLG